jgi:hypothetical protein
MGNVHHCQNNAATQNAAFQIGCVIIFEAKIGSKSDYIHANTESMESDWHQHVKSGKINDID